MASIILPMQIFNFFYTYANFLPTIFNLSPNFIPKSPKITQFSPAPLNHFNAPPNPPKKTPPPHAKAFKKLPHSHIDMRKEAAKKAPRLDAPALIIIECQNSLFLVAIPPYWDCPNVVGLVPATFERHVGTWHL